MRDVIIILFRLIRPTIILGIVILFFLGAGIAAYLGNVINWLVLILGLGWMILIQASTHYFYFYYDIIGQTFIRNDPSQPQQAGKIVLSRSVALWAGLTCLTIAASITVVLIRVSRINLTAVFIMLLIFIISLAYSLPPVRLANTGYGELTLSIVVANLTPAFALLILAGESHRLLAMVTFPLTFFHLAMLLAFSLEDYATDLKYERRTMMVRMGWQRGMEFHNLLILAGYGMLGIALLFGLPIAIALPGFLTLPLGLFQIWHMNRIRDGRKPNWAVINFVAFSIFGLTAYLITFTFWTR